MPFIPSRGVIGADFLDLHPDWKIIEDPYSPGEDIVLVPATKPDFALIHAYKADKTGNVLAPGYDDRMVAQASDKVIVTVEEIVDYDLAEDPRGGDWTREGSAPPGLENQNMGTAYLTQNANKKSITLDLKSAKDIEKLKDLVRVADVFVENFRPGTASRLGLSYENIKEVKPNIIYCSISGFGQDGPISNRPAYDHIVQGMCGICLL